MQEQIINQLKQLLKKHKKDAHSYQNQTTIHDYVTLTQECAIQDYSQQVNDLSQWLEDQVPNVGVKMAIPMLPLLNPLCE